MIDFIESWWKQIVAILAAAAWVGGVSQKILSMSNRIDKVEKKTFVTKQACDDLRIPCQLHQEKEFNHGEKLFDELKQQIAKSDEANHRRYEKMMGHLLALNERKES